MNSLFKYKISNNSFILVKEDSNNWLHVVDDSFDVHFFSVSDIETALDCKLTLINSIVNLKATLH